jgi:hypothetical protein
MPMATPDAAPELPQPAAVETWTEPGIWRPSQWPGRQLDLNVTENENPGAIVGFGNETAVLFSYGGGTPGPTIRMRGDKVLLATLRNWLGQDFGTTPVGPYLRLDQAGAWSQSLSFVDPNHPDRAKRFPVLCRGRRVVDERPTVTHPGDLMMGTVKALA